MNLPITEQQLSLGSNHSESTSSQVRKFTIELEAVKANSNMNRKSTKLLQVALVSLSSDSTVQNAITMLWSSTRTSSDHLSKIFSISAVASSVWRLSSTRRPTGSFIFSYFSIRSLVSNTFTLVISSTAISSYIKPDSFLMGIGKRGNQVNVIDRSRKEIPEPKDSFAHPLLGEQELDWCRSLFFYQHSVGGRAGSSRWSWISFLCSNVLPSRRSTKKQKYDRIREKKMTTPTDLLCRGFPNEFGIFLNYNRALRFDDKPDCSNLCKLFRDIFVREDHQ